MIPMEWTTIMSEAGSGTGGTHEKYTELMQLLQFTPDDLAVNRDGKLAERQKAALHSRRQRTLLIMAGIVVAAIIMATLLIFFGQVNGSLILTIIGAGVTICAAAISGVFARHVLRLNADLQGGSVMTVTGKLERIVKPLNRSVATYILRVGEVEVTTSKEVFREFTHESYYRLYLTPYTRTLLSAETGR
jgi:hypothetical protein